MRTVVELASPNFAEELPSVTRLLELVNELLLPSSAGELPSVRAVEFDELLLELLLRACTANCAHIGLVGSSAA